MTTSDAPIDVLFRYFTEIAITAQLSGKMLEKVFPDGMTLAQFGILNHLARVGDGQLPVEIARAMQVTKGTMTSTLGALQRAGRVSITPDATDGRSKRVHLTPQGRQIREAALAAVEPELRQLAGHLSLEGIVAILPTVERVRKLLDAQRDGSDLSHGS